MNKYVLFILVMILFGFTNHRENDGAVYYKPVLMERSKMETSIAWQDARNLEHPAKIYYKDNFIYISERYKGVHVIDNSDSTNPQNIGFIRIPGCIDMAIKNDILYADNAVDLVAIDISGSGSVSVTKRIKNVFPEILPPNLDYLPSNYDRSNRPADTEIVEWVKVSK